MANVFRNLVVRAADKFLAFPLAENLDQGENHLSLERLELLLKFLIGGLFEKFDILAKQLLKSAKLSNDFTLEQTVRALVVLRNLYSNNLENAAEEQRKLEWENFAHFSRAFSLVSDLSMDLQKLMLFGEDDLEEQISKKINSLEDCLRTATLQELTTFNELFGTIDMKLENDSLTILKSLVACKDPNEVLSVLKEFLCKEAAWKDFFLKEVLLVALERLSRVSNKAKYEDLLEPLLPAIESLEGVYNTLSLKIPLFYSERALAKYYELIGDYCSFEERKRIFEVFRTSSLSPQNRNMDYTFWRVSLLPSNLKPNEVIEFLASLLVEVFEIEGLRFSVQDKKIELNIDLEIGHFNKIQESGFEFLVAPELLHINEELDEFSTFTTVVRLCPRFLEKPYEERRAILSKALDLESLIRSIVKNTLTYERSKVDHLTLVYSRTYVMQAIEEVFQKALRDQETFCVFVLDVDFFKLINDKYGHKLGDQVLRTIGDVLRSESRFWILGRFGGEEFFGVLKARKKESAFVCEEIKRKIREQTFENYGFAVTVSIGVAENTEVNSVMELVGLADQRLYKAKRTGKNRVIAE